MKILAVKTLLPDVRIIRFARVADHRGYFTETLRRSDIDTHPDTTFLRRIALPQVNESLSQTGTVRGLHFQWSPFMGKLVRTTHGHMVDIILDIRLGSPTFGRIAMYDMPASPDADWGEWIWVPPGFAHGNFSIERSRIEYFCSSEYNPGCEAAVSPLAPDLDWSLCDPALKRRFDELISNGPLMTNKDRDGFTLAGWQRDHRSGQFVYGTELTGASAPRPAE
jgi:dTDP-4-dehydrorhamnose 3,5-epimerase